MVVEVSGEDLHELLDRLFVFWLRIFEQCSMLRSKTEGKSWNKCLRLGFGQWALLAMPHCPKIKAARSRLREELRSNLQSPGIEGSSFSDFLQLTCWLTLDPPKALGQTSISEMSLTLAWDLWLLSYWLCWIERGDEQEPTRRWRAGQGSL